MIKIDNNTGRNNISWAEVQLGGRGLSYPASQVLALVIGTTGGGRGGRSTPIIPGLGKWKQGGIA